MNDEQLELVTAYIDGEATPDERADVEADAALLAEVERQRAVRGLIHDIEPPSVDAREGAIAAALAVFDDEIAQTTAAAVPPRDVTAPTNIVPFEHRRRIRWMQGLGAAAAVAVVVVAGAVIATRGGDDNSNAGEERIATSEAAPGDDDTALAAPPVAATSTVAPQVMMATASSLGEAEAGGPATAESTSDTGAIAADEATEATGGAPAVAPPSAPGPAAAEAATTSSSEQFVIATEDDLVVYVDQLKEPPADADGAEADCADGLLKADATFEAPDGTLHAAVAVTVDDDTVGLLTLDDCGIALEAER